MKTFRLKASLDSGDSQKVVLLIKSGSHKGETVDAYSLNGYLYGANCKVGTRVIDESVGVRWQSVSKCL